MLPCYQTSTLHLGLELQESHSECHISGVRKEEKNPCQVLHIGRENEAFCSHPKRIDVFNKAEHCCILIPLRFQKQLCSRGRKQDRLALVTHCCWPQRSKPWHRGFTRQALEASAMDKEHMEGTRIRRVGNRLLLGCRISFHFEERGHMEAVHFSPASPKHSLMCYTALIFKKPTDRTHCRTPNREQSMDFKDNLWKKVFSIPSSPCKLVRLQY